jgi:cobalt-zinc-cadmium efflux system outer membrane protein
MRRVLVVISLLAKSATAQERMPGASLDDLVREALEHNPEIRAAWHRVEASRARASLAGALPDPVLTYGVINEGNPVPFQTLGRADFSEAYLGASQDVPYPGKRRLRREAAQEEAAAEEATYEGVRRRVAAEVAEAYYDLYATHAGLETVDESRQLLQELSRVANARLSVGQIAQQDAIDAQVELTRLDERTALLEQRRAIVEARLRSVLYRNAEDALGPPETAVLRPLTSSLNDLLARAEEAPLLKEKRQLVSEDEKKVNLARRDRLPDFGFSFVYHNRDGHFFRPFYTFGGTATIPNLHGRQRKAIEEAVADVESTRGAADAARAQVRYEVTEAYRMATTSEKLLRLYDEAILRQTHLSLDSAMAEYRVGKVDFLTLVSSWRRLLDYELTYQEQLADHEKALARLEIHVGSLTPVTH